MYSFFLAISLFYICFPLTFYELSMDIKRSWGGEVASGNSDSELIRSTAKITYIAFSFCCLFSQLLYLFSQLLYLCTYYILTFLVIFYLCSIFVFHLLSMRSLWRSRDLGAGKWPAVSVALSIDSGGPTGPLIPWIMTLPGHPLVTMTTFTKFHPLLGRGLGATRDSP